MTGSCRAAVAALTLMAAAATSAHAQGINPGPPGPFVVDLRGATVSLPGAAAFYPPIEDDEEDDQQLVVPARGFGFDVGAHVYPFRLGPARIGIGVTFGRVRATALSALPPGGDGDNDDEDSDGDGDSAADPETVQVVARGQTIAPQLSFNFGTSEGWSYLSVGYGRAAFRTRIGDAERETDGLSALNFGGGARWFFSEHLGVGFDLRWHKVGAGAATPKTTLFAAVVGLSVK